VRITLEATLDSIGELGSVISPGSLYLVGIEDLVMYSNTHPEWFGVVTDKGGLCLFSLEAPGRGPFNSREKVGA
jgi:hypothetical protein